MNSISKSWKRLATSFGLVAAFSLGYIEQSKAFTLIELVLLPAVQLVASQSALITVTNVTQNSVEAIITVFFADGSVKVQKTEAIARDSTFTLPVHAGATGPLMFHATVELGTANATVSDVMTLDKTNGQIIAILPFIKFDTN
ncbi:MAG: hypothetical protein WA459_24175 [Stellaceae bacterium]